LTFLEVQLSILNIFVPTKLELEGAGSEEMEIKALSKEES
jgi:hypothetical protein